MKGIKTTLLVVAGLLVFAVAFTAPVAAQQNNVISIGDVHTPLSTSITTPISINNATSVAGIKINLSYNPAIVNVTNYTLGDFDTMDNTDLSTAQDGYVVIWVIETPGGLSGNKTVANVELTAVGSAQDTSDLNISIIALKDDTGDEVTDRSTDNGTFTIYEDVPPAITNPIAYPQIIPEDTDNDPLWGERSNLSVLVTDESAISSVTIDLSPIGGSATQEMTRIGSSNIWNVSKNASVGSAIYAGGYIAHQLQVNATDEYGNSNISVSIELMVMKNGDVTGDGIVDFGDGIRIVNYDFSGHDPKYSLPSDTIADVTGDGNADFGDGIRIVNYDFSGHDPKYILK